MQIFLRDVHFYAPHGITPQEKLTGNEFTLNLEVEIATDEITDNLASTLSYADLYEIAKEEMERPTDLIESVALRIGERLKIGYPQVVRGFVEIVKVAPPIPGIQGSAGVRHNF